MKTGDIIHVRACKADGSVYRSWQTAIESVTTDSIVTISPAGELIRDRVRGEFVGKHILRSYYWLDKSYNLIEAFETDGTLVEIYINIASPPWFEDGVMNYTDHELDVSKYPPSAAQLIDEDEFAEAVVKFQYTDEFQQKMYRAAREAIDLANHWQARPVPTFGGNDA
jgi:protein associated with RNAse G/E